MSVSCGIVLHHLAHKMQERQSGLSQEDEIGTKIDWALRTIQTQRFV